jgi:hypothetical protein
MTIICCGCFIWREGSPVYLPQVATQTHATLFSSTSRTVLTQKFVNPNKDVGLEEVNYSFPLYDGVSVAGFTCKIGDRTIKGEVKEREQARKEYNQAKENSQFAGLLQRAEKSADVFMTSLGNVPAGGNVSVEIAYLGELKHDAEVDGLRYTVPSIIAPRYGQAESFEGADNVATNSMSITVDAEMPSAIKSVQSPSHAVSVNIGTTSIEPDAEPTFKRASASLSLQSPRLEKDFILQIVAADLGQPSAMMETHPNLPNHRALMTTLVPKFGLPPIKPEIVFICDRSGSMSGRIEDLKSALGIFLKSLPPGVKFNICSFGTQFSFLWEKSSSYTEQSLEEALKHVAGFQANFGGTQIFAPMKETLARRFQDIELEAILLTDGQIWDQDKLFDLIKSEVALSLGAVRVFTLGVGSGASSSLIEGAARAGNGAAQTVTEGEKMDKKVIRTLKASLSPHVTDYTLEIKYEKDDTDDFELVEKVMANVSIDTVTDSTMTDKSDEGIQAKPVTTSLYDPSYQDDTTTPKPPSHKEKYADLPAVPSPSYLQAPYKIPQLFAFNRTTIYVLMSESTPGRRAKSVVLRGTSKQGPLELEVEIQHLENEGETIHQLAARKAVQDLESDGGWLAAARTSSGNLFKDAKASQFSELVEREAVRLGIKYQVSGKWCSFIAVEEGDGTDKGTSELGEFKVIKESSKPPFLGRSRGMRNFMQGVRDRARTAAPPPPAPMAASAVQGRTRLSMKTSSVPQYSMSAGGSSGSEEMFSPDFIETSHSAQQVDAFGDTPEGLLAQYSGSYDLAAQNPLPDEDSDDDLNQIVSTEMSPAKQSLAGRQRATKKKKTSHESSLSPPGASPPDALRRLVAMQSFVGAWTWTSELEEVIGAEQQKLLSLHWPGSADDNKDQVSATVCVILFFRKKLSAEKETWEMVVEKAEEYLEATTGQTVEDLVKIAGQGYQVPEA